MQRVLIENGNIRHRPRPGRAARKIRNLRGAVHEKNLEAMHY